MSFDRQLIAKQPTKGGTHSLYAWMKKFSPSTNTKADDEQANEMRRLKRDLVRVTEERDILKKGEAIDRHWFKNNGRTRTSPKMHPSHTCKHVLPVRE